MQVRDRIRELRRVPAAQLRPNVRNWRKHPAFQQDALRGLLAEIGYADALLARELADGSLELIDGHLRAETTPDAIVPVLIVDLDESEANKLLAALDPLAALAEADHDQLASLLSDVNTDSPALQAMFDDLLHIDTDHDDDLLNSPSEEIDVPELYQVVVECDDEPAQQALYERLHAEGFKCRLLML